MGSGGLEVGLERLDVVGFERAERLEVGSGGLEVGFERLEVGSERLEVGLEVGFSYHCERDTAAAVLGSNHLDSSSKNPKAIQWDSNSSNKSHKRFSHVWVPRCQ